MNVFTDCTFENRDDGIRIDECEWSSNYFLAVGEDGKMAPLRGVEAEADALDAVGDAAMVVPPGWFMAPIREPKPRPRDASARLAAPVWAIVRWFKRILGCTFYGHE